MLGVSNDVNVYTCAHSFLLAPGQAVMSKQPRATLVIRCHVIIIDKVYKII